MTPELVTAFLTPVSVVILAWFAYLTNQRLKKQDATLQEVHRVAVQVDEAVNGKVKGETSISQDVTAIRNKQEFDNPSETPEGNGGRALVPMVAQLTSLVERLLAKTEGGT